MRDDGDDSEEVSETVKLIQRDRSLYVSNRRLKESVLLVEENVVMIIRVWRYFY